MHFGPYAHAHDAARHSAILFIVSPTKRCGKTNLLTVLQGLVPKALPVANITPATVFRAISRWKPTLLIDEADTFVADKSDLRGVLNSGHTKSHSFVIRCVGDEIVPTVFSTWSPKAFASIGRMHPTLEDRSIPIALKRKLPTEIVQKLPKDAVTAFEVLRRKCARWADDHLQELREAQPNVPKELNDGAQDNWEPLLAIADLCGADWGERARKVARRLSGEDDDQTFGVLLLHDIREAFDMEATDRLSSSEIVSFLSAMEERPWPEYYHGKAITPRGVARLLEPFKIKPRQVVLRNMRVQGYHRAQFEHAWRRYAPGGGLSPASPDNPVRSKPFTRKKPLSIPGKRSEDGHRHVQSEDERRRGSGDGSGDA